MPPFMSNDGCYTGSLGNLTRWLGEQAEALGVMVFPGFPAAEVMFSDAGAVTGVVTQDMGVAADGSHKRDYQPGMEIHAKYTLFAEGARGNLTKQMKARFDLEANCQPQVYGLGIKELWDIDPAKHVPGRVIHTQGWPLSESDTWGGGFLYHQANGQVALGFVTALDYKNPYVSPFQEFQRWKQHPAIREYLEGGTRVAYGARVINEGGWQSVPKLAFPGGALVGCAAGFVNVPRIKGSHTAMKSGMLAAEAVAAAIAAGSEHTELGDYEANLRASWIAVELKKVQNAQPLVAKFGGELGTILAGADMWMRQLKIGVLPAMKHHRDYAETGRADLYQPIDYPKPDGKISFDRLTSVSYSFTNHAEDQPCHLQVADMDLQRESELGVFAGPSTRYCPAGVYEWLISKTGRRSSRSTRKTASTARPVISRTRTRTSTGPRPKAAVGRTIRICEGVMLKSGEGLGCAGAIAGFNFLLMGLVALSFSQGPYSSFEQELWYRYRSIGLLFAGAILPALVLWLGRRSPIAVGGATVWMFLTFWVFVAYVIYSGGGV